MLKEDAKIIELVDAGLMRDSTKYVKGVLSNCYLQYQKRKWAMDKVLVRIGRTGNGTSPNYRIELITDATVTPEQAEEHWTGKAHHPSAETAFEFSGLNHAPKSYGFDKETWSKATQTVTSLEELRDRLKKGNLRLP